MVLPLCCKFFSYLRVYDHIMNSNAHLLWIIELQTKWPVLHWPGHMGVAWNVSLFFSKRKEYSLKNTLISGHLLWIFKTDITLCCDLPCRRSVPQPGPVGRSWHSFTPVSPDHIFLFGGFTTERETLSEFDTSSWVANTSSSPQNDRWSQSYYLYFQVMLGCTM